MIKNQSTTQNYILIHLKILKHIFTNEMYFMVKFQPQIQLKVDLLRFCVCKLYEIFKIYLNLVIYKHQQINYKLP